MLSSINTVMPRSRCTSCYIILYQPQQPTLNQRLTSPIFTLHNPYPLPQPAFTDSTTYLHHLRHQLHLFSFFLKNFLIYQSEMSNTPQSAFSFPSTRPYIASLTLGAVTKALLQNKVNYTCLSYHRYLILCFTFVLGLMQLAIYVC